MRNGGHADGNKERRYGSFVCSLLVCPGLAYPPLMTLGKLCETAQMGMAGGKEEEVVKENIGAAQVQDGYL
ncbi:hypothetical protein V8C34DRAFT_283909 [Trichoderma compactum]